MTDRVRSSLSCLGPILGLVLLLSHPCMAQNPAWADLLDSPVKHEEPAYAAGEVIACSLSLGGSSVFAVDTEGVGASFRAVVGTLFAPFTVFEIDEACNAVASWNTAIAGSTQTGIAIPNGDSRLYWAIDPSTGVIAQYVRGTGVPTGVSLAVPSGTGVAGPSVIDDHRTGEILCYQDIVEDLIYCIDLDQSGSFVCSFANADNTGGGAFGNGLGDSAFPDECNGATLVVASGTINEGQTVRAQHYDCDVFSECCRDYYEVGAFSTFINDIDELDLNGEKALAVVDNAGSNFFILVRLGDGFCDCQSVDPDVDMLWVNGQQGGVFGSLVVDSAGPISTALKRPPSGNGRFVFHLHEGAPTCGTVMPLLDLGSPCFPFVLDPPSIDPCNPNEPEIPGPTVVANNIGKTNRLGASSYFGTSVPDPGKAPTFVEPNRPVIDLANLPSGSIWTAQAIVRNAASSSTRGVSITNPIVLRID